MMVRRNAIYVVGMVLAASSIAGPVHAQAYKPGEGLTSVWTAELRRLAEQVGGSIVSENALGVSSILAKTESGLLFSLVGQACDANTASCRAVLMQVIYTTGASATDAAIGEANTRFPALKVARDPGKTVISVSRHVVLDDGVTGMNLQRNLQIVLDISPSVAKIALGVAQ